MERENVFSVGFGPVGNTEKKSAWADYEQLFRAVFSCFQGQKKSQIFFKKNTLASALKSCIKCSLQKHEKTILK